MDIVFSSRARKACRPAVEKLLFFNPGQRRVRDGIINSLGHFGHPQLEETSSGLAVRIGDSDAQTLFAYDRDRLGTDPVGAVVFLRTSPVEVAILHVAVHPNYALKGMRAGLGLGVILVEKVKEIASRIAGVRKIIFFYRQEVVIQV